MARLTLEEKKGLTIKRTPKATAFIPANDAANFHLLKDNRHTEEKFSRVCKLTVNHYYLVGTEWLCEKLFYPSVYGFEEIEKEQHPGLLELRDRLIREGIGLWGQRPVPNIKKPVKRLALECRPQRMRLECKE